MNTFITENFNRIFERDYTPEQLHEKAEKGSTSEKMVIKVLNDLLNGTENISFYELWSTCSDDLLKRLAETPHTFR